MTEKYTEADYERVKAKIRNAVQGEDAQLACECLNIVLIEKTNTLSDERGEVDPRVVQGLISYGRWAGEWGGSGKVVMSDGTVLDT